MEKNKIYEAEITGYNSDGLGICKIENMICFVKGSVRKDVCLIRIIKVLKNISYGIIEKLLTPSPFRIPSQCPHFPKCGGCDFHHLSYDEELWFKKDKVKTALQRIAGISTELDISPSPSISNYRNKAQYPIGMQSDKVITGFYRSRSHEIIPMTDCLLQNEIANKIALFICNWFEKNKIPVYDEITHSGTLRHIYIRCSSTDIQVCLVSFIENFKNSKLLINELTDAFPNIKSIVLNHNPNKTNAILGKSTKTLYGNSYLEDTLCDNIFKISPLAFYQINKAQTEILYNQALEYADLSPENTILDLYCGIGTITLHMAKKVKKAYGIEIVEDAIINAKENALANNISNVEFFCADAGLGAEKLLKMGVKLDVISVDPPRKGMDKNSIDAILELSPKKIVYISCDCATMARDVKIFSENGYKLKKAKAFDMFPRTSHVETCVLLSHKNS